MTPSVVMQLIICYSGSSNGYIFLSKHPAKTNYFADFELLFLFISLIASKMTITRTKKPIIQPYSKPIPQPLCIPSIIVLVLFYDPFLSFPSSLSYPSFRPCFCASYPSFAGFPSCFYTLRTS